MSDTTKNTPKTIADMAANIRRTLDKNGFPANSVALPLERLYEAAHRDGLNFNKVLEHLAGEGVSHAKTAEKIIFSAKAAESSGNLAMDGFPGAGFEALKNLGLENLGLENMDLKNMDLKSMMAQAANLMKSMSPDQLANLKKMYDNMSPEERSKLMDLAKSAGTGR